MARYYFNLVDDDGISYDDEGQELPSLIGVQAEAAKAMADMAWSAATSRRSTRYMAIDVRDDVGPVMQLQFNLLR